MGGSTVSLVRLDLDRDQELLVTLADPSAKSQAEYLGQIELAVRLEPKRSTDRSSSILSALSHAERQVRKRKDMEEEAGQTKNRS